MGLLFLFPLVIITILYTVIGIALWKSSRNQMTAASAAPSESSSTSGLLVQQDGGGGGGLLGGKHRRRHRGTSCKEILCCSFNCFQLSGGSSRRDGTRTKELKNTNGESDAGAGNGTGRSSLEFRSLRPPAPTHSSPYSSQREFQTRISTNEPIVVVKFEDAEKASFHRRHLSHRGSKKQHCQIVMNASNYSSSANNGEGIRNNRRCEEGSKPVSSIGGCGGGGGSGRNDNDAEIISVVTYAGKCYDETSLQHQPELGGPGTLPISSSSSQNPQVPGKVRRMRVLRGVNYGTKALEARRKIIKMLIIIVVTFAVCNLPFHGRKIWQNWSESYDGTSTFSVILTQVTTIIRYANSAINPLLYAFMSAKFRQSLADLLGCRLRRSFRGTRNFSVRSTNVIPLSTAA